MIFLQSLCGFLQFLDAIGDSVTDLHSSIVFEGPGPVYSGQYINNGLNNDIDEEAKSTCAVEGVAAVVLGWQWQLWTIDLLDTSHVVHVDLVFPCARHAHNTAANAGRPRRQPRTTAAIVGSCRSSRRGSSSPLRRLVAAHEEWLTYAVVVATLQVFLRLNRANVTTLFLPTLAHATGGGCGRAAAAQMGDALVAAVTACGVLGSALAARHLGREAMCAVSGALAVLCQVAVPAVTAAHAGLCLSGGFGGGGARMMATGGHAAAAFMAFALACAVAGGLGWAWGALFWAVPSDGVRSVRQAAGAAIVFGLGFVQLLCFLLTLRQLKHAAFAYYAVWIWS